MEVSIPQFLQIPISELELLSDNPRDISEKELKALCNDIRKDPNFLMQRPPLVNDIGGRKIVYAGSQRFKAAKKNGETEIWVWIEKDVPKHIQEERMLKDNLHRGEWNLDKLKDFDTGFLSDVGFGADFLSSIFKEDLEVMDDNFDVDKAYEEIKVPITQPGDIYILGNHRLICGDSQDVETIRKIFANERASMIYCDPPYNIGLSYDKGIKGNSTKKTYTNFKFSDNKKPNEYRAWIVKSIENAKDVCRTDGSHVFYWCDPKFIGLIQDAFHIANVSNKNVCFWLKNQFNPVKQIAFNRVMEPCIYGTIGKPYLFDEVKNLSEVLNKEVTGKNIREYWQCMLDVWFNPRVKTNDYEHPTQKPVTLHEKPLRRCTSPGDVVVDLYGGSGSTLIACEQMKRQARLVEMDPVFCDVIVKRWEKLTGSHAEKA